MGGGTSPTADMTALSCRKPSLYILLFLVSLFLSVPLGAQDVPEWVVHYRRVYPDSQYIAQRGGGESAEDARNDALSALARYVNLRVESSVKTARSTEIQSLSSGDASVAVSYEKSETSQETTVTSDIELPGVEMTEPYYYEAAGSWYCVAYLNRARAYLHLQPEIEDAQSVFMSFIGRAKKRRTPRSAVRSTKKRGMPAEIFFRSLPLRVCFPILPTRILPKAGKRFLGFPPL